jgi:carbonyl reductase 1
LAAVQELGPGADLMLLDLGSDASIDAFAKELSATTGGIDCLVNLFCVRCQPFFHLRNTCLPATIVPTAIPTYTLLHAQVNNAGTAYKAADPTPFKAQCGPTLKINFHNTLKLTQALLPLLEKSEHPHIVNVASLGGVLKQLTPERQKEFSDPALTLDGLSTLVGEFEKDVASGDHHQHGWGNSNYGMSKLSLIAATKVLARNNPRFKINACCPGYCKTDMSSHKGTRSPAEGARNATMCAVLEDDGFTGQFIQDEQISVW